MQAMQSTNTTMLPSTFFVYRQGDRPVKIHAVDWEAWQANGWSLEPVVEPVEPPAQEVSQEGAGEQSKPTEPKTRRTKSTQGEPSLNS